MPRMRIHCAEQILGQMTQEQKISLLHGYDSFYTAEIADLKVPKLKMSDGPVGTRNDGASTAYPAVSRCLPPRGIPPSPTARGRRGARCPDCAAITSCWGRA